MRLANLDGRAAVLVADDRAVDVATASGGRFGPDPHDVYADWVAFRRWAEALDGEADPSLVRTFERSQLGSPSPTPTQVLAIGLNYSEHAAESGFTVPDSVPPTFTKFVSAISGPDSEVVLPSGGNTDWEVELVVVIGRVAHRVAADSAWDHVAGLAVGQDISERITQSAGPSPQFSLGKSFPGFAPIGPWLVTPDEVPDRDDLALGCAVDGETVQDGRTSDLVFPVPALIEKLTAVVTLHPGDVIFTGTPSGVGMGRTPQRFLRPGERLESWVEGIGSLHQTFVAEEA